MFFKFFLIYFVMLREAYTMGCLQDSLNSKGCRGMKKKRKKQLHDKSFLWSHQIY